MLTTLTTQKLPNSSGENSYFLKNDNRVVVYNHITERSMVISKEAATVLQFLNEEKTYGDLFQAFPKMRTDELKQFISECIAQGYAYAPCSEKAKKKHISIIYYPEKLFIIRNKFARCFFISLFLISPVTVISEIVILRKKLENTAICFGEKSILGDILIVCFLLFISMLIHEISHAIFAKSIGANVGEISSRFEKKFPPFRIYTRICGISYIKKRSERLLLYSAGILSHFFLISFSLFVMYISINALLLHWAELLICVNTFFILVNLLPFPNTDGFMMLSIIKKSRKK